MTELFWRFFDLMGLIDRGFLANSAYCTWFYDNSGTIQGSFERRYSILGAVKNRVIVSDRYKGPVYLYDFDSHEKQLLGKVDDLRAWLHINRNLTHFFIIRNDPYSFVEFEDPSPFIEVWKIDPSHSSERLLHLSCEEYNFIDSRSIDLSPDGSMLAFCEYPISVIDVAEKKEIFRLMNVTNDASTRHKIRFSPDSKEIWVFDSTGTLEYWKLR